MPELKLTREERLALVPGVQTYLRDELDVEIGDFDTEFLVDHFVRELGPLLYNRALRDARALWHRRMDELGEALVELEAPTVFDR